MKLSEILINLLFGLAICCGGMFASTTLLLAYPVVDIEEPADGADETALANNVAALTGCATPIEALVPPVTSEREYDG